MDWIYLIPIAIFVIFIAALIGYFVSIYNRFFSLKNSAEATLGQVRVAMKKRLDMIEQLLDSVKSYAKFEREVFEKITSLRATATNAGAGALREVDKASRALFGNVVAVAENYPDLKTSSTVTSLMGSVKGIEEEIARQRYTYNNIVQEYNIMQDTIPSKFVGVMIGLTKMDYLQFEEEIEKRPKIEF